MSSEEFFPLVLEKSKKQIKKVHDGYEAALKQRCEAINSPESTRFSYERVRTESGTEHFLLSIHSGKGQIRSRYLKTNEMRELLNLHFEKYRVLPGYRATYSYEKGEIEAEIRPIINLFPGLHWSSTETRYILGRLSGETRPEVYGSPKNKYRDFQLSDENRGITLRVGSSSPLFSLLFSSVTTITITGLKVSEQEARDYLEKIANAAFFEIDLAFALPLNLVKGQLSQARTFVYPKKPQFPQSSYDADPLSLYWYARSANRMPLQQFLAFYQVIEHYFATYLQLKTRDSVLEILKEPGFDLESPIHIKKLHEKIKRITQRDYTSEQSQLKYTIQACLEPNDLWKFLTTDTDRKEAFTKSENKLSKHMLPLENEYSDVRDKVAERVYDIRCKVVHTKSDTGDDKAPILPFSKEAEALKYDIELIQYMAQQVFISAKKPLQI